MPRPIPPPYAWQAIAAFGGLFTLFSALADPVDLWRISVRSHQGAPLHAVATLESLPEERITDACLSLGTEADAPPGDAPLLKNATLKLNPARTAVEIRTDAPVSSPALELVLRVQCPGTFLYARHFSLLIPPAGVATARAPAREGFRLKVAPGESVASLVATVAPGNRKLQQRLARDVIAANPHVFPDGKAGPIPAGAVLWFPDLRRTGKAVASEAAAPRGPAVREPAAQPQTQAAPPPRRRKPSASAGEPIRLRQALELGEKPGPQECRMLLPLCGAAEPPASAPHSPASDPRASGLEAGMQALKLRQESIDTQLARLEQSLADLRKVVESHAGAAEPAAPPKPEIRTVVKTEYRSEPLPWYFWAGIAVLALAAGAGGFLYGRRRAYGESLAESDSRLDEILASAADEMRELDRPLPPVMRTPPRPPHSVRDTGVADAGEARPRPAPAEPAAPEVPEAAMDTLVMPAASVDLELDSGPRAGSGESVPVVTSDLAFEMDQALDNTRSMFTDVDRFIALGRTQNALSLLQFQVVKDPKDRDSWIKLLAIYRQEKMDTELEKALREFRRNFPNDKATI